MRRGGRRARGGDGQTRGADGARRLGRLDILVNNAGVGIYGDLVKTSAEDYDTMMDSNMRSTFLFARHAVPVMIERGAGVIINVASMAGVMGFAGEAAYCATKFAQVGFTQALDRELRPRGIKVGAVCPGGVKTEFAIGTGRTEEGVAQSGMLEADDVAAAALLNGDAACGRAHHRDPHAPDGRAAGRARSRVGAPVRGQDAMHESCWSASGHSRQ